MHLLKYADKQLLIGLFGAILTILGSHVNAQYPNSVLSTGEWLKISISKSGIYQIDPSDLSAAGWNVSALNPAGLKLYGNGGSILPQKTKEGSPADLIENAIWVTGQEDGKLDPGDRIYFYGEGTQTLQYDTASGAITHTTNIYSDTAYYFLTWTDSPGLRVKEAPPIENNTMAQVINEYVDYQFYEKESVNLLESGRDWWGDFIASRPTGWQLKLSGVIPGRMSKFTNQLIAGAPSTTSAIWRVNGVEMGSQNISSVPQGRYALRARNSLQSYSFEANPLDDILYFEVSYDRKGEGSAIAYLDYFSVQLARILQFSQGQQRYMFLPAENDTVRYSFQNTAPANITVWDVTNISRPEALAWQDVGQTTQAYHRRNSFQTLYAFAPSDAFRPDQLTRVNNQNIRNLHAPDLLIVTVPPFRNEAERLAEFRRSHDNLDVEVVTAQEIYNEYASGKQDVTAIRDFVRFLYKKEPGKLKYLLLLGSASYDFRNIRGGSLHISQMVPSYQSRESLDPVYTYASDDYFGFLKDDDGEWHESESGDQLLDIGIGRLPVKTLSEARVVVDKLIYYASSPKTLGKWRNRAAFIADDGDGNLHQLHASSLATIAENNFLPQLLFNDAFPSVETESGRRIPAMNQSILTVIKEGASIINFSGHGDMSGWTQEQIFTLDEIQQSRGYNNLPLFVTATCEFGRFDNPWVVSGAEQLVLSPRGGSIGVVTTTRPVYASNNFALNQSFYKAIDVLSRGSRLGDIIKMTKNTSLKGSLNRNFTLLGDPSMQLARGENQVRWISTPDTLRPLELTKLEGGIFEEGSDVVADWFTGVARVSVYDQKKPFKTLGNGGASEEYSQFSNLLFEGAASVIKGKFEINFRVPAAIAENYGSGRVSVYAMEKDSISDASGELMVITGGKKQVIDRPGSWEVSGYIDSPDFKNGDPVSTNPVLFVNIKSEWGVDLTAKGIVAVLNDTTEIRLNKFYVSDSEQFENGHLVYQFDQLLPGRYSLKLILKDLYNNTTEKAFDFLVGKPEGITINEAIIFPNPFEVSLGYKFTHNREGDDIQAIFRIYNPSGDLLFTNFQTFYNSVETLENVFQPFGIRQKYPSYLYELSILSLTDGTMSRRAGWLLQKL